jgi:hypothetical protein
MKNVLLKASSLLLAVLLTVILFLFAPGTYEHPLATIINKVALVESTAPPRIIFIGGSSVLVGINSEMVSRHFCLPVVNMAVYGGYGISDMLHLLAPRIGRGDIVVIIPEYHVLKGSFDSEDVCDKWILLMSPAYAMKKIYFGHGNLQSLTGDISDLLQCKIEGMWGELWKARNPFTNSAAAYDRRSNRFGDLMKNWQFVPAEKLGARGQLFPPGPLNAIVFNTLNDFNNLAARRGASVYFNFCGFPAGEYQLNRAVIEDMADQLRHSLRFAVIGSPTDTLYPYEMFADTVYHLRFEGRDRRTATLIAVMEKAGIRPAGGAGARQD